MDDKLKPSSPRVIEFSFGPPFDSYELTFDSTAYQWRNSNDYNMFFLQSLEKFMNETLKSRGHVFLNEIYDGLGMKRTSNGSLLGWIKGEDEDRISFGLDYNAPFPPISVKKIVLHLNVQGMIWDLI